MMDEQTIREVNIRNIQEKIINTERALIFVLQELAEIRLELDDIDTPKISS